MWYSPPVPAYPSVTHSTQCHSSSLQRTVAGAGIGIKLLVISYPLGEDRPYICGVHLHYKLSLRFWHAKDRSLVKWALRAWKVATGEGHLGEGMGGERKGTKNFWISGYRPDSDSGDVSWVHLDARKVTQTAWNSHISAYTKRGSSPKPFGRHGRHVRLQFGIR